jgi:7-carboxy-7-deazaguanine synthase
VSTLVISEVFGPTFQGEGRSLGRRAAFVRLGGCDLRCTWCDSAFTWDASRYDLRQEMRPVEVSQVVASVGTMGVQLVVISGGEPLLQQRRAGWAELLAALPEDTCVEVETNGTVPPTAASVARIALFTVSPKLAHGGDPLQKRFKPDVLRGFATLAAHEQAILKVVVKTPADVGEAARMGRDSGWPANAVYVMPEGIHPNDLIDRTDIAEAALACGVQMTTRLHVLTWGAERGR